MVGEILFYVLLLLIAFLYSSVGHGGASGYLALMAFFSFDMETMRSTALLLNIFLQTASCIIFLQHDSPLPHSIELSAKENCFISSFSNRITVCFRI